MTPMTILAPRMRCALGVLVPLVLVAGCGDIARDCTTIGGDSGVTFEFSSVDELAAGPRLEVEGCVDSTCESWTVDTRDGTQVFVQVAGLDGETA
ncbi:hypothetical protein NPS01_32340 [Nocardioides psychrotolerans]|uniref:Uncharacterized protein n=1 Tax=Nocardioides psychrotolerans TaxID=1005945 RepID=A0A1I3P127_9ACTN|nr:hypothetical protein [Nocardioides psychrotolerans]GEP39571.1 hypothetical protein NPS01_32340 [Nocardioides psychrotolerans]SFJ14736.1 hypothetical protein SAMN05216561_11940 [Nocardioides psychrotolerans]